LVGVVDAVFRQVNRYFETTRLIVNLFYDVCGSHSIQPLIERKAIRGKSIAYRVNLFSLAPKSSTLSGRDFYSSVRVASYEHIRLGELSLNHGISFAKYFHLSGSIYNDSVGVELNLITWSSYQDLYYWIEADLTVVANLGGRIGQTAVWLRHAITGPGYHIYLLSTPLGRLLLGERIGCASLIVL